MHTHQPLTGFASVYNVKDSQNDIVLPGAFDAAITAAHKGIFPKLLWQHKSNQPIGKITSLTDTPLGLKITAQLFTSTRLGKDAAVLVKDGALSGLSIGFQPLLTRKDTTQSARLIVKAKLWEVSIVTFPANTAATIHQS